jgi:hypothetical protein
VKFIYAALGEIYRHMKIGGGSIERAIISEFEGSLYCLVCQEQSWFQYWSENSLS